MRHLQYCCHRALQGAAEVEIDAVDPDAQRRTLTKDDDITKFQHIIPKFHLKRFAGVDGRIWANPDPDGKKGQLYPVSRKEPICVNRLWSDIAERWSNPYELAFDRAFRRMEKNGLIDDQAAITNYWALCRARALTAWRPPRPHPELERRPYEQDEKDRVERQGFRFESRGRRGEPQELMASVGLNSLEGDETRTYAAAMIRWLMDYHTGLAAERKVVWQISRSPDESMALPDVFPVFVLPARPDLVLWGEQQSSTDIQRFDAAGLSESLRKSARRFLVARSSNDL